MQAVRLALRLEVPISKMKKEILTILSAAILCGIVAIGLKYQFPDKDMFYWQLSISMIIGTIVIRLFNRR